jgi:hypothetical protein
VPQSPKGEKRPRFVLIPAARTKSHGQRSLTISELHHSFALFLFSFSGPMTQNGRGATKWGKAKKRQGVKQRHATEEILQNLIAFGPAAGITLALIAIVSSIGLLGYVAIKLL